MTIRHIRFFVAVCEAGGVTRAAEALHVAQPVVSTAIAELEKYYGIRLFERINQRLVITEEGKRLLVKARDALAGFEDFEALAKEGSERLQLRLGATLTIGRTRLPKLLCEIREKYPELIMIGGYDKTVMHKGEAAIRAEFERILPAIRSGRYIPSVDHQTPPAVSVEDYKLYMSILREYSQKIGK